MVLQRRLNNKGEKRAADIIIWQTIMFSRAKNHQIYASLYKKTIEKKI